MIDSVTRKPALFGLLFPKFEAGTGRRRYLCYQRRYQIPQRRSLDMAKKSKQKTSRQVPATTVHAGLLTSLALSWDKTTWAAQFNVAQFIHADVSSILDMNNVAFALVILRRNRFTVSCTSPAPAASVAFYNDKRRDLSSGSLNQVWKIFGSAGSATNKTRS